MAKAKKAAEQVKDQDSSVVEAKPKRTRAAKTADGEAAATKAPAKPRTRKKAADAAPKSDKPETRELALAAAQFAIEKKAENVRLLDLREVTSITDFFVVASADTDRQVKAIAENVIVEMRDRLGQGPWRTEGWDTLRWVIVDFVDFVVHVLQSESRTFYNIERLWADAPNELIEDTATAKPKRTSKKKAATEDGSEDAPAQKERKGKIRVIEDMDAE